MLSIGPYPAVSLKQARLARDEARSLVAAGEDPSRVKQERALAEREVHGQTFKTVAQAYRAKIEKEGRAVATLSKIDWFPEMANASFGDQPVSQITAPVVLLSDVSAYGAK